MGRFSPFSLTSVASGKLEWLNGTSFLLNATGVKDYEAPLSSEM